MIDNNRINELLAKLETLLRRQDSFVKEINELRNEINMLRISQLNEQTNEEKEAVPQPVIINIHEEVEKETETPIYYPQEEKIVFEQPKYTAPKPTVSPKIKSDIEKFIGENLINKIGIAITVIGVAIGAKYSIEHELISPLTRIILGYLMGLGLLGFGIKLKKKYENYSAVLVSGAIAILYFITYSAYSLYDLIPQAFAFILMVFFTGFTIVAAINYNKQVIAHIGLVGAYAVPFLLSDGSGKVYILFTYMAIINAGILFIAFKRYWKPLYFSSFAFTWLIFFSWYVSDYQPIQHFRLALIFLSIFFATFYLIFLAYKLIKQEKFIRSDVILLMINSSFFYGLGYAILNENETGAQLLGLFTLGNAFIHFIVSAIIYKQKLADRNLFFLIAGLVLVFITIAVPVQLDGNWVTLLWACEAALLFWIGRTKNVSVYEKMSYPLMLLAFFSIIQDWEAVYNFYYPDQPYTKITPLFNINFLNALLFVAAFAFIIYLNHNKKYTPAAFFNKAINTALNFSIPAILLIVLYNAFRMEISTYWNQLYLDSAVKIKQKDLGYDEVFWNNDYKNFEAIWAINYSLLFLSILSFINIKKIKNSSLTFVNLALNVFVLLLFLSQGLYTLSELRDSYLNHTLAEFYHRSNFNLTIRYISFVFVVLMLTSTYLYLKQEVLKPFLTNLKIGFDFLLCTSIIWIASSELITWMDMRNFSQSYKLGLSILWGVYALFLIVLGIWKKKKHLRIGAIAFFAITLIKLFFYDIADLDTIAKTIVFVSLGILLLIISFLYNKYKHFMTEEENEEKI